MAKTRNVTRYGSAGLFLADTVSDSRREDDVASTEVSFFNKLQSFQFSVDTNRQNIKQIGSDHFVARTMVKHGAINVNFDYLLTDGHEENLLGLNILGPNVKYDENGEEYHINVQNSGTIYNNIKENKSLFFVLGDDGRDLTSYANDEYGLEGTTVLGIGNCFLSNYSISASVGGFASASVGFSASDFNFDCMDPGGGFYWEKITQTVQGLLTENFEDNPDEGIVLFQEGSQIVIDKDLEYQRVGAIRNPSLDLINKGIPLDKVGFPSLTFIPNLYKSAASAIPARGINVKIKNLNIGGPTINAQEGGGGCYESTANIQSFDVSIPFEREEFEGFESMHMYGSKLKYPQLGTFSMSLLQSTFESGRFIDIFCGDQEYEIEIDLENECHFYCAPTQDPKKLIKFKIDNARLDGYSFNQTIDSYGTVDCSFSFEMSTNQGLFASGTYGNNKSSPCHRGPSYQMESTESPDPDPQPFNISIRETESVILSIEAEPGTVAYGTDTKDLYVYFGGNWYISKDFAQPFNISIRETESVILSIEAEPGTVAYGTDTQNLYVYFGGNWYMYEDFIQSFNISMRETESVILSSTPEQGTVAYGTDTQQIYIYDDNTWRTINDG
jgi:hypothetical protein